jgi:type III pantothenate kinase
MESKHPMLLLIDIGNTRIKWAAASSSHSTDAPPIWLQTGSVDHEQLDKLSHQLLVFFSEEKPQKIIFSNVAGENLQHQIEFALLLIFPDVMMRQFISSEKNAGLMNHYDDPKKLGSDRFASAIAAHTFYPHSNLIVATCGTATTVDAVNNQSEFMGGMILPGLKTMAISLAQNTAQLPQIEADNEQQKQSQPLFATNTSQAILSGCIQAQVGAILCALKHLEEQSFEQPILVITGGAAPYLLANIASQSKVTCHHIENLVLAGLYVVAKYESL